MADIKSCGNALRHKSHEWTEQDVIGQLYHFCPGVDQHIELAPEFGDLCDNPEPHVGHMRVLENGERILCEGRLQDARQPGVSPFGQKVVGLLSDASETYKQRNAVYRDNFRTVGKVMEALFPDGAPRLRTAMDFDRWHIFELDIVKLTRYVANWDNPDPDSLLDRLPYLSILGALDDELRERIRKELDAFDMSAGTVKITDPPTPEETIQEAVRQLVAAGLSRDEAKDAAQKAVAMFDLVGGTSPWIEKDDLGIEKSRIRAEEKLDELREEGRGYPE